MKPHKQGHKPHYQQGISQRPTSKRRAGKARVPGYSRALLVLVCLAVLVMAALVGAALFALSGQKDAGGARGFWSFGSGDGRPVLALDAGHGGKDPGAMAGELTEADINRVMLDKLSALLEKQAGELRVVVTSQAGEYQTPGQRGRNAKSEGASLLVSLHLNANQDSGVRGFSCLPIPPGRPFHEESLSAAQIFIEEAQAGTGLPVCGQTGVFYTFYLAGDEADDYTKRVMDAAHVDETTHPEAPTFGVLEHAGCPGLLVEQWYLTNEEDMRQCYSEEGMNQMAASLYRGICRYFGLEP